MAKKDIKLLYVNNSDDRTYRGFGSNTSSYVRGIYTLLQKVAKILFTTIGSDLYNPNYGSNLPIYLSYGPQTDVEMSSYVNMAISQTEELILADQLDQTLDDSERLVSLNLQAVTGINQSDWVIELFVKTASNETYLLRI